VRAAGLFTFLAGGVLVVAAWFVGAFGLRPAYLPVTGVLAEVLGVLAVIFAVRFRRSRLALAAVAVALANTLLRGPLADDPSARGVALLAILLPVNLGVLSLLPDRPVLRPVTLVHLAAILVQPWVVTLALKAIHDLPSGVPGWMQFLQVPQARLFVFLIAGAFTALAFTFRQGVFEGGLLWALVASAVALSVPVQGDLAALMLAACQLVMLFAVIEDSYRLAYVDELTGLRGRRAFNDALRSLEGPYALAMIDVDRFKRFNDRYGHEAGDQALRMVADELRAVGRGGRPFRYGGEEFAIVFAGRSAVEARNALEELRAAIAARRFAIRSTKRPRKKPKSPRPAAGTRRVTLTVSMGVAGPSARRRNPEAVLRAADQALYRAKRTGRNKVVKAQ